MLQALDAPRLMGLTLVKRRPDPLIEEPAKDKKRLSRFWNWLRFWRRREKKPKKIKFRDWERLLVWDHFGGDVVWAIEMPLRVLYEHLRPDCRYTFESTLARRYGGAVWGGIPVILFFGLLLGLDAGGVANVPLFWAFVAPPFLALPMAFLGYFHFYTQWMKSPIWLVRRVAVPTEIIGPETGEIITDERPEFHGISHTRGTGVPPEATVIIRRTQAIQAYQTAQARRRQAQRPAAESNGHQEEAAAVTDQIRLAEYYEPSHYNSVALYEVMNGKDVKEHFKSGRKDGAKLERVSMAGMALGSVGMLIVAMLLLG